MFSAIQTEYIRAQAETMRAQGYPYYLAVTQYRANTTSPDMLMYFSKNPITAQNMYAYTINTGLIYQINSSAYSTTNTGPRFTVGTVGNTTLSFSTYEFIYTNATWGTAAISTQPDIMLQGRNQINAAGIISFVLLIALFFALFSRILR